MLPANDAEALILSLVKPLDPVCDAEAVDLAESLGQILAQDITSNLDFPHWDNSAMDGYAVRFADVQQANAANPVSLTVVEDIPAGKVPQQQIQPGQTARILTGSMMPAGADTIVIQENTQRQGDRVVILSAPQPQGFVRHRASYHQAGATLLKRGTVLNAPEIAILAAAQCPQVMVYRRPTVAILSTGDELVDPNQPLQPGQIVDSNQYALAALVAQAGAMPLCMGIVPDDPAVLEDKIAAAIAQSD
ncbi:MAG: molybdopterin molybdotransferase MoeA, partial [Cyanobacteria bacterium P01_H01_bin.119]